MEKRLIALTAVLASVIFGAAQNPKMSSIPDNTWRLIDSAGPILEGRFAYGGGAYDRANHQFLAFGGGHWDGWHNDVISFDIATDAWRIMYPTDSAGDHNCGNVSSATPGMLLASGLPASRHTYDQIDFIDHLGKLIMWSGPTYSGIWGCTGQTLPADTWLYDYAANEWAYKNVSRQAQPSGESHSGAYDPVGRLYYAIDRDGYFYPRFWSYNPDTDAWTLLAVFADSASGVNMPSLGAVASMDTRRQRLWVWPVYYDIPTKKWVKVSASGAPSSVHRVSEAGSPFIPLYYDEANDVMVSFGNGGTPIYVYDIALGTWQTHNPPGAPGVSGYLYGRFFYNPVDQVFMMIQGVNYRPRTWAYCYKRSSTAAEARTARPPRPGAMDKGMRGPDAVYDIGGRRIGAPSRSGVYIYRIQGRVEKRAILR